MANTLPGFDNLGTLKGAGPGMITQAAPLLSGQTINAQNTAQVTPTANIAVDPATAAAQATAAANAAKSGALRGNITNLVNQIKDIFNSRYGQVDAAAGEQVGNLNTRYANEINDLNGQIQGETAKVGASAASSGTYDSSYRGNNVDTVTKAGESQIRDTGNELQDNLSKIAQFATSTKAGYDAEKNGQDAIMAHLNEETNPDNLVSLRNQLDAKIASLKAGSADNNTQSQNLSALQSIAPSNARAVQLKTTLSSIVGGTADPSQKAAIAARIISSSGLTPQEQQELALAFQSDLATTQKQVAQ